MKTSFALSAVVVALLTGGCSSTSTKNLTENSARNLIQGYTRDQKHDFTMQLTAVFPAMRRTVQDYTSFSASGGVRLDAVLKRLLDHKLVVQHSDVISYRKVNGTFSHRDNLNAGGQRVFDYTIESVPGSNELTGNWIYTDTYRGTRQTGSLKGAIAVDDKVTLVAGEFTQPYAYVEEGGVAHLRRSSCFAGEICATDLVGKPTGQKVEVKWYEYSFSPEFQKRISMRPASSFSPQQASVSGGGFEIGEVSGLRLMTDTEASAAFGWHVALNDVGHALLGDDAKPTGTGSATFAKKPDGTWFVDHMGY
jgi:hypothetical protein